MGDRMKFFIFGYNDKDIDFLTNELSSFYKIDVFKVNSINEINKVCIENKDWIINCSNNYSILCNLADTIILLDYSKNNLFKKNVSISSPDIIKLLQKHIRKGIILRNRGQLRKYLKSVYEGDRYNF